MMRVSVFLIVCLVTASANAFSPQSAERMVSLFSKLTKIDEVTYAEYKNVYKAGGWNALTKAMEGNSLIRDNSARGVLYLRLAAESGTAIRLDEAAVMTEQLHDVPGLFRASRRLLMDDANAKGAAQELRIASGAIRDNGEVVEIRRAHTLTNIASKNPTDVDVLLNFSGKNVAIESKNYASAMSPSQLTDDAANLLDYVAAHPGTIPCMLFFKAPTELAQRMLASKGIPWVSGDPPIAKFCVR